MENIPSLYNTCLRKVSLFLIERIWNPCENKNPFSHLPANIVNDLVSTMLRIQTFHGFRAEDLKLLLTSGIVQEFKMQNPTCFCHNLCNLDFSSSQNLCSFRNMEQEIAQALQFLTSGSQNLEVLQLTHGGVQKVSSELSIALQELIRNSPKLKYIHSKFAFQLKVLRSCKQLKSILLHFFPQEPWYGFLETDNGNEGGFKILESLEIFTICRDKWIELSEEVVSEYIMILLMHCPSLSSLGSLETSRALAKLHHKSPTLNLKLRRCHWKKGRWIKEAVKCNCLVEELTFSTRGIKCIEPLKNLRNLVSLNLWLTVEEDTTVQLDNILKDIGIQLKDLKLLLNKAVDISRLLKHCPNLEALEFDPMSDTEHSFTEPTVTLPNLKELVLRGYRQQTLKRLMRLLSDCHSLTDLKLDGPGFDVEVLNEFLKKNSFRNLKTAYFLNSDLTKQGFKAFLLSAPNLEKVDAKNYLRAQSNESALKDALIETNHKAVSINYCLGDIERFFHKNMECNARR